MSVSIFLGVRAGFPPEDADRHLEAIKVALREAGQPEYDEAGDLDSAEARHNELRKTARCKVDTLGPAIQPLGSMIVRARGGAAGPFRDFSLRTERVFVPGEFTDRISAPTLPGRALWSTTALRAALHLAALTLGLPLVGGEVPEATLQKIDGKKKLGKNDQATDEPDERGFSVLDHYRPSWLTLSEYARLAHENKLALVLI